MKSATAFAIASILIASPAWSQAAPPVDPDSERQVLAQQIVDLVYLPDEVAARLQVQVMNLAVMQTVAWSGGAPDLDEAALQRSFEMAAAAGAPQSRRIIADLLARELSPEILRATLAFYQSPEGREAVEGRYAYIGAVDELRGRGAENVHEDPPEYVPTPAEVAFFESSVGEALAEIEQGEAGLARVDLLQGQLTAAGADYCAKLTCGADHHDLFRRMAASVAPNRFAGERANWGLTAGDLFPDPLLATLARAACAGDPAAVAAAVRDGADPNAAGEEAAGPGGGRLRMTPLLWAIDCGSADGINALLDMGADPNQSGEFGITPMTVATANRDPAILHALLERGGDPNANEDRKTLLEIALDAALWMERVDNRPKTEAWRNWNALLAAGADPDRTAPEGMTLVQTAAYEGVWAIVEGLIGDGWAGDPVSLARTMETASVEGAAEEERAAYDRVKAELIRRGVRFPVGPLNALSRDARGFYLQP